MSKKILVIDDNLDIRESLSEILELSGYAVETAEDGTIGVRKALSNPPDLILCDVMMPKLDGYGVLNILSKKPATADIPFIYLTAKAEKTDWRRGMNLGADDYINKPFYKDELLTVIEKKLNRSDRLRKKYDNTGAILQAFIDEAKGVKELQELPNNRQIQSFAAKETVFQEGDLPRYLYHVRKGKIKVFKTHNLGKELIIKIYQPGDFMGYVPLIEGGNCNFSAAAIEPTEVDLIPSEEFLKLLYTNRNVSVRFIKLLAANISYKEEQLLNIAYSSVRKRVADAILTLHEQTKDSSIGILRTDLAQIVGTTKESVVRALSEFRDDNWIRIENGYIEILEVNKMERILG